MQQLQKDYAGKDVNLFLFPCNQFLFQEPDTNAKIKSFASGYLNISKGSNVVLFSKSGCNKECHTTGPDQCVLSSKKCCTKNNPVYDYLKSVIKGPLSWNFNKFVIGRNGIPVKRYGDAVYLKQLESDINNLLGQQ